MPFSPVATLAADVTMPRAVVLDDTVPAERVPEHFPVAGLTLVMLDQIAEWHTRMLTRQQTRFVKLRFSELSEPQNVLDGAATEL
jgi:hypothetical protein